MPELCKNGHNLVEYHRDRDYIRCPYVTSVPVR